MSMCLLFVGADNSVIGERPRLAVCAIADDGTGFAQAGGLGSGGRTAAAYRCSDGEQPPRRY